jgi:nicotinamidase-related amidase
MGDRQIELSMGNLKAPIGPDTVHVCLDMQRLFGPSGPWATPWMIKVLPTVVELVERAPSRTVFTRFIPPQTPDQAHGMWRPYFQKWSAITRDRIDIALLGLMPELEKFVPPARMFDKPVYSAFATGELHGELRRARINTLIITGAETDVCVLSTILAAIDLGYRIIVVKNALCSSADESHDALIGLYARRFDLQVELADADELLETWKV